MEEYKIARLRRAISAVVFKEDKFLLVAGKDWPENAWCFPQGGLNNEETQFDAVKRELKEEFSSEKFEVLAKSKIEHSYLFPIAIAEKKGFDGQYQTIWFVRFLGNFNEIKSNKEELSKFFWFDKEDVVKNMRYPEQKETFIEVLKEFDKLREERVF